MWSLGMGYEYCSYCSIGLNVYVCLCTRPCTCNMWDSIVKLEHQDHKSQPFLHAHMETCALFLP